MLLSSMLWLIVKLKHEAKKMERVLHSFLIQFWKYFKALL